MNITGTLPQAGNLKLFVPSLSTQGCNTAKTNITFVIVTSRNATGQNDLELQRSFYDDANLYNIALKLAE